MIKNHRAKIILHAFFSILVIILITTIFYLININQKLASNINLQKKTSTKTTREIDTLKTDSMNFQQYANSINIFASNSKKRDLNACIGDEELFLRKLNNFGMTIHLSQAIWSDNCDYLIIVNGYPPRNPYAPVNLTPKQELILYNRRDNTLKKITTPDYSTYGSISLIRWVNDDIFSANNFIYNIKTNQSMVIGQANDYYTFRNPDFPWTFSYGKYWDIRLVRENNPEQKISKIILITPTREFYISLDKPTTKELEKYSCNSIDRYTKCSNNTENIAQIYYASSSAQQLPTVRITKDKNATQYFDSSSAVINSLKPIDNDSK